MMISDESKGFDEGSLIGFGFGSVLGGWIAGVAADLLALPINSMAICVLGAFCGGVLGYVAGRIGVAVLR